MLGSHRKAPVVALGLLLALAAPANAGGLRCSVGEVVIENLAIGHTYSLTELAHLPLTVTSTCEESVTVAITPLVPDSSELRSGAAPVPAPTWASVVPEQVTLAPNVPKAAEMRLTIPNDPALLGRRFQVTFWTHTQPQPGSLLAYGLKSRVIFSIAPTADAADAPVGDLALALQPGQVRFERAIPGRTVRLEALPQPLTVRNTSDHAVAVELTAKSCAATGATLHAGEAELLDRGSVRIEPASFTLGPGESRTVAGTVSFGPAAPGAPRDLACVIAAAVTGEAVRTEIQSRLSTRLR